MSLSSCRRSCATLSCSADRITIRRLWSGCRCLALVYALRGDGPHAVERLDRACMVAMKRGNIAEVEEVVQRVDKLISASNPRW